MSLATAGPKGTREAGREAARGRWIPWAFVGLFGVMLAANGALVYAALSTWTGLDTINAYDAGRQYDRVLAAQRAQDALGWQTSLTFVDAGAKRGRIAFALANDAGAPLDTLRVRARFFRPTHGGLDKEVALARVAPGRYAAEVVLPAAGQWELHIIATTAGGTTWREARRIFVAPAETGTRP